MQFVQLCVLCGCDYCPSVPGVGIVTAYKLVETYKSPIKVGEQQQAIARSSFSELEGGVSFMTSPLCFLVRS